MKMEKEPRIELLNKINTKELREFIADRGIKPEDFPLIEKLASFPKNTIIMSLHNMFGMYKERSGEELIRSIKNCGDEDKKKLYETALEFYNKYGWAASWNLVGVLERI